MFKRSPHVLPLFFFLEGFAIAGGISATLQAQSISLSRPVISNGSVQFNVGGLTNLYYRVDSSLDLREWTPVDAFLSSGTNHSLVDPLNATGSAKFYRARQVDPELLITDFSPASGPAGTQVTITGQFFASPAQTIVKIGSTEAKLTSGTTTRLVVQVPPNAVTSLISVTTPTESQASGSAFSVSGTIQVNFAPPTGMSVSDFQIVNNFGNGTALASPAGAFSVPTRLGSPVITYAAPNDTNRPVFFSVVSVDTGRAVTLDATSTAETLVFQNPQLTVGEPDLAASLLSIIHSNSAVQSFAQLYGQKLSQGVDPLADPAVGAAYQTAVISVATGAQAQALALAAKPISKSPNVAKQGLADAKVFPIEPAATRFIEVKPSGLKLSAGVEEGYFNPVEWLVSYQKIDLDTAFPEGRDDFLAALKDETQPQQFPIKSDYYNERSISANFASSRLNIVSALTKVVFSALVPKFTDDKVVLPSGDAVYLIRGVGPGLRNPDDTSFVASNMNDIYVRAVAFNIASAAIEIAGLTADKDDKEVIGKIAEIQSLAADVLKRAPGVVTAEDFEAAAYAVAESLIKDFMKDKVKSLAGKALKFISSTAASITDKLKKIGQIGQVAERVAGLGRTTGLETSFVMVGDPFALQIISVVPNTAAPGEDIKVQFKGPKSLRAFRMDNSKDSVRFEGTRFFDGQVVAVQGPDANGIQTVTVRIPAVLGSNSDGQYTMYLTTQGRRGSSIFNVQLSSALSTVTPLEGFRPAADFLGSPFLGTKVRLQGSIFTSSDTFVFSDNATVAATNVIGSSTGDVSVYVPAAAITGPIQILHPLTNGNSLQITGPVFRVLGPPRILSADPLGGPSGTMVVLSVTNAGSDPSMIRAQFTGGQPSTVSLLGSGLVGVGVPNNATNGPLTIITPAGSDSISFTVLPPVPFTGKSGSTIQVGGTSVVTLQRAIAFANGDATPEDDADAAPSPNGPVQLDPPFEEGDYVSPDNHTNSSPRWPVGANFQDYIQISGTNSENVDFVMSYDTVGSGGAMSYLTGKIVISGHNNAFSLVGFTGEVIVTGYSNRFSSCTFLGPVSIVGTNTSISSCTMKAPMTVLGDSTYFSLELFTGITGTALTVKGNRTTGAVNIRTNFNDGVVIDGGKYNTFTVNSCLGNGGNGVTLTGGAFGNSIKVITGNRAVGTGNRGHGVVLIGNASGNIIDNLSGGIAGNDLDGLHLDGPGVTLNQFPGGEYWLNGGNGVTIANGASLNKIGDPQFTGLTTTISIHHNGANGVMLTNCGPNSIGVQSRSNVLSGVLLSGAKADPYGTAIVMGTGGKGQSNGKAGLRLENGTRGAHVLFLSSPMVDYNGVELDGSDVATNLIEGLIQSNINNGVVIRGAHDNELRLNITANGVEGLLLQGASHNLLRLDGPFQSGSNGVHVTLGSFGNKFTSRSGPPFKSIVSQNLNGVVFDTGAHDNLIEQFSIGTNRQDGTVFSGQYVSGNQFVRSDVLGVARDGIRFEQGASENIIGSDSLADIFLKPEINIQNNGATGIHIVDSGTKDNVIRRCFVGYYGVTPVGILAEKGAGVGLITRCAMAQFTDSIVIRDGASNGRLFNLTISGNTNSAITISNAWNIRIGADGDTDGNSLSQSRFGLDISGASSTNIVVVQNHLFSNTNGIYVHGGATGVQIVRRNLVETGTTGIRIEGANSTVVQSSTIQGNQTAGITINSGAANNQIVGNIITNNTTGVLVADNGSTQNQILGNSITRNSGKGIQLSNGGNLLITPPTLTDFNGVRVNGTSSAPDGSHIEIFKDGSDEGETLIGSAQVLNGHFGAALSANASTGGAFFSINGTVTDPNGNTSEFSGLAQQLYSVQKIAYTTSKDGNREVYYWNGSGSPTNITTNPAEDYSPALSLATGCNQLVFVSSRAGNPRIYVMDLTANIGPKPLLTVTSNHYDPAWLIGCQRVVYVSEQDGNAEIYSANIDGTNIKRLTTNNVVDRSPTATLDGSKIAFISNRTGSDTLFLMNADGTDQHAISSSVGGTPSQPALSPDGNWVAFVRTISGKGEVCVIRTDGSSLIQATADSARAAHPVWMSDGTHLVFSSDKLGNTGLFSILRTGGSSSQLPIGATAQDVTVGGR